VNFAAIHSVPKETSEAMLREIRVQSNVLGQDFPTLLDIGGQAAKSLQITETPTFLVFGPEGVLRYRGPFDDNLNAQLVKQHFVKDAVLSLVSRNNVSVASNGTPQIR
jgi:hypothetical protein